jgi:hypothetical protein
MQTAADLLITLPMCSLVQASDLELPADNIARRSETSEMKSKGQGKKQQLPQRTTMFLH